MNNLIKRLIILLAGYHVAIYASCYSFEYNGLYYNITSENEKTVEVASYSDSDYVTGDISIPSRVSCDGVIYSVTAIGPSAFYYCSRITSIVIPSSITSIGSFAFSYCSGLNELTIPNSVTEIGSWGFSYCSGLNELTIPNSVAEIGYCTFYQCTGMTKVNIEDLTSWYSIKFSDSTSNPLYYAHHLYLNDDEVTKLVVPETFTKIGDYVFCGCGGLNELTIPNSVTEIGNDAFLGCTGMKKVNITDLAAWCSINFGSNTSNPLYYAHHLYLNDNEVTKLVVPETVTNIRASAFYGCSGLTEVTIPNSVTSIGEKVFSECSGLTKVTCNWDYPITCSENIFESSVYDLPLYIPKGTTDKYYNTVPWYRFTNVIEIEPGSFEDVVISDIKVEATTDGISITNDGQSASAFVYSVSGQLLKSCDVDFGTTNIDLQSKGVYFVKIGNRTYKIAH